VGADGLEAVSSWSRGARKFHLLGVLAIYGTIFIFLAENEIPSFGCTGLVRSFPSSFVPPVAGRPRVDRPIRSLVDRE
jgi:hypothetical protein